MIASKRGKVAFLSTFPPRECGLATFTQDLVQELDNVLSLQQPQIVAVSDKKYHYDERVIMELVQHDFQSYIDIAERINKSDIELLVIEHEYGIFGGECGEYLLNLIGHLKVPFITTFHTVLPNPSPKQKEILVELGQKSSKVVTMAKNTIHLLRNTYNIPEHKIEVIHHGVPYRELASREELKAKHGYGNLNIISTFGLISPGKGLEYAVEAMCQVVQKHQNVRYLILGQTHPGIKQKDGESYRYQLMDKVNQLNLTPYVEFVDKYLTKEEIIEYLQMSDIYMTPYLNKDQAVSGTLAYAIGYGRVVVSTPYSYAKEMLAEGRGLLAEFRNSDSLAKCIMDILDHPEKKSEMEEKTRKLGETMMWDKVANQYAKVFTEVLNQHQKATTVVV